MRRRKAGAAARSVRRQDRCGPAGGGVTAAVPGTGHSTPLSM
ncbi:MAG: hypothetical protein AVDCRST_MAG41-3944 [uncultured Corynebacteriales bacterium]|uniref:Uncharacterized protein n=1 Tax=uncultured Mycobacteriales bacterium TaxID=581187 RepID=A0A6J4JRC8_9ACTN|nr:MAG: hypothetical protein AVDCRST_MAG41-3944 [uncultured Corynebacteriales bacterium]